MTETYKAQKLIELQKLALSRGGKLVSSEYNGANNLLEWECAQGHRWTAKPSHISGKSQTWCRQCNQTYSEKIIRIAFETVFKVPFPNVRPDFMKTNKGRNLELDGFNESLKLAFEFDGRQHFEKTRFQNSDIVLKEIQQRDKLKDVLAQNAGITLLRFGYRDDFRSLPQSIKSKISTLRADLLKYDFTIEPNYSAAYQIDDPLINLREIAKIRGGMRLSKHYINADTALEWECALGHRWWQKPDHIKNTGTWCKRCAAKKTWMNRKNS